MKDFFGTVIELGDAVLVASGERGKGVTRGTLVECVAKMTKTAGTLGLYRLDDDRRICFGVGPENLIAFKSIGNFVWIPSH